MEQSVGLSVPLSVSLSVLSVWRWDGGAGEKVGRHQWLQECGLTMSLLTTPDPHRPGETNSMVSFTQRPPFTRPMEMGQGIKSRP